NYAFFNWLTIALCIFLFDDQALSWIGRRRVVSWRMPRVAVALFAGLMELLGATRILEAYARAPDILSAVLKSASVLQIGKSYGLFAGMTTARPEIIVEGSDDGERWEPYEFRYKPGRLDRAPKWVAPFQPRLDWQMWFAALSNYRENLWFV